MAFLGCYKSANLIIAIFRKLPEDEGQWFALFFSLIGYIKCLNRGTVIA